MADYTIKILTDSAKAEQSLDRVDKKKEKLAEPVTVRVNPVNTNLLSQSLDVAKASLAAAFTVSQFLPGFMDVNDLLQRTARGATTVATAMASIPKDPGGIIAGSFKTAGDAALSLSSNIAGIGFAIFGVTQSVNLMKAAYSGFFEETVGREIRLQEVLLQTKTAIAANSKVLVNEKEITDPYKAIIALGKPIEKTIENIRVRSLEIAGTTSDAIIQTFGVVSQQIGQFNGTLKDAEDLSISFAGALGTLGMSDPTLAVQEVRSILTGNIGPDSLLARTLGITGPEIAKAKASTEGLVSWLTKKLAAFTAGQAIASKSFFGITSNLAEIRQELLRALGKPVLDPILTGLSVIYDRMSAIVKPAMLLSETMGKTAAAIAGGIGNAVVASPLVKKTEGSGAEDLFGAAQVQAERFMTYVKGQISEMQPVITKFVTQFGYAFVQFGEGLAKLIEGYAQFKFEGFKVFLNSISNLATALNVAVLPALNKILQLYGELLQLPPIQYLSQYLTQWQALEQLQVLPMTRGLFTLAKAWGTIMLGVKGVQGAIVGVGAAFETMRTAAVNALVNITNAVRTVLISIVNLGVTVATASAKFAIGIITSLATVVKGIQGLAAPIMAATANIQALGVTATKTLAQFDFGLKAVQRSLIALGTGIQAVSAKAAGAIGGLVKSVAIFYAQMLLIQVAVTLVMDLMGRFTKMQEDTRSAAKAAEALKLLETTYKDVGEASDKASIKAKEAAEQIVSARYDQLTEELAQLKAQMEDFDADAQVAGINSMGEAWRGFQGMLGAAIDKLKDAGAIWKSTFFDPTIKAIKSMVEAFRPLIDVISKVADAMARFLGLSNQAKQTLSFDGFKERLIKGSPLGFVASKYAEGLQGGNDFAREQTKEDIGKKERELAQLARKEKEKADAEDFKLQASRALDLSKQLKDLAMSRENELHQMRMRNMSKEIDVYAASQNLLLVQANMRANAVMKGEQGAARTMMENIRNYLNVKKEGENSIEVARRRMTIEVLNMEREMVNFKYNAQKQIAELQKAMGAYETGVADYKYKMAVKQMEALQGSDAVTSASSEISGAGGADTISKATAATARFTGITNECASTVKEFMKIVGINSSVMDRSAKSAEKMGKVMTDWSQLKPGDIVARGRVGDPEHVGVYTGDSNVFHQSGSRGLKAGNYPDLGYFKEQGYFIRPSGMGSGQGAAKTGIQGYTNRLGYLESDNKWQTNREGSGATGFFQFMPSTAKAAEKKHNIPATQLMSKNYGEASAATARYIAAEFPKAYAAIQRGDFATADKLLSGDNAWPSLPGGKQFNPGKLAAADKLAGRTMMPGTSTPSTASTGMPTAPQAPNLKAMNATYIASAEALNKSFMETERRLQNISEQITKLKTKEAFDNIANNLFPTVNLKEMEGALADTVAETKQLADAADDAYNPEMYKLGVAYTKQLAQAKRAELEGYRAIEKLQKEGVGLNAADEAKARAKIKADYEKHLSDLAKGLAFQKGITEETKKQASIESLRASSRNLLEAASKEKRDIALRMQNMLLTKEQREDPMTARNVAASVTIDDERRRLRQTGLSDDTISKMPDFQKFSENAQKSAKELGELERSALKLQKKLDEIEVIKGSVSGGIRNILMAAFKGGDISGAISAAAADIGDKFLGMATDMLMKPIEQMLDSNLRNLLGVAVKSPQEANTAALGIAKSATEQNTAALQELTAAFNNIRSTSFGPKKEGDFDVSSGIGVKSPDYSSFFSPDSLKGASSTFDTSVKSFSSGIVAAATGTNYFTDVLNNTPEAAGKASNSLASFFTNALNSILNSFGGGKGGGGILGGLVNSIGGLFGGGGGGGNLFSSGGGLATNTITDLFSGVLGFAGGGNPPIGKGVMVGENGPELSMARGLNTIIPSGTTKSLVDTLTNPIDRSAGADGGVGAAQISYDGPVLNFNSEEYVRKSDIPKIVDQSVKQSHGYTRGRMRDSPAERRAFGMRG